MFKKLGSIFFCLILCTLIFSGCGTEKFTFETTEQMQEFVDGVSEIDDKDDVFNSKYGNLPTCREVQYNKFGYLAQEFTIEGTAELDDYYNYGYDEMEPLYFCMHVTPTGGGYSDSWYIYANRTQFSELYNKLLNGTVRSNFVARLVFHDTGGNNMATLCDYKQ